MRRFVLLLAVAVLALPVVARAAFHISNMDEILSGFDGDSSIQYVQIRELALGQTSVQGSKLVAFDCGGTPTVLLTVPANVVNSGNNSRWIMATPNFAAAACLQPDFVFQPGIPGCGMICWGKPGTVSNPNDVGYVDCVAYNGYHGTTRTASGTPVPSGPGDGQTQSLTRQGPGNDNSADFALADPSPVNNAGLQGHFGAICPATTTTSTTVPVGSTTTTTLPSGGDSLLGGKRITLKDNAKNPAKRSLVLVSSDASIGLGAGNGSADDPTLNGGSLRLHCGSVVCDQTFTLVAGGWAKLGKGAGKGYRYRDPLGTSGPVRLVMLKPGRGRLLKIVAKGSGLPTSLATDPQTIDVVLGTGAKRYCLRFDGAPRFRTSKLFSATGLAAPAACP